MTEEELNNTYRGAKEREQEQMAEVEEKVLDNAIANAANAPANEPANGVQTNEEYFKQSVAQTNATQPQQRLNETIKANAAPNVPGAFDTAMANIFDERAALEKAKQIAMAQEPRLQRAEAARQWMSGIGDALSGAINLGAVINNASPQQPMSSSPIVNKAIEEDRARRRGEMERLNKQIDDYGRQYSDAKVRKAESEAKERIADKNLEYKYYESSRKENIQNRVEDRRDREQTRKEQWDEAKKADMLSSLALKRRKIDSDIALGNRRADVAEARIDAAIRKGGSGGGIDFTYGRMLDEIAGNYGYDSWNDLASKAKSGGDRTAYELNKLFFISSDKASPQRMKAMISECCRDYAPKLYAELFGGDAAVAPTKPLRDYRNGGSGGNSGLKGIMGH